MNFTKLRSFVSALALTLSLASCGTAYQAKWNAARDKGGAPGSIEGAWEGKWLSSTNGHTGKLWCLIGEGSPNERNFDYRATWGRILSGSFSATHQLQRKGDATTFVVDHPIGKLGTFHAEGTIADGKFSACYQAAGDRGTLELTRPTQRR
jgi:hypothetical protein